MLLLGDAESDLLAARVQMAFTLGSHIILACFGVGMPVLLLVAEWLSLKGDSGWRILARRWSKAFAVLFAIGAVSGTVLSFELGILWPEFMARWGSVIGLPFTLEGFAFFTEAIFAGIYLYGWDRLPARTHWLAGIPIAIAGTMSAWFVVTANAWMNSPVGFRLQDGSVIEADPIAAMLNPATGAQTTHMILAAFMVTGFSVATFYAWQMLRGNHTLYVRRAMTLGLAMGAIATPFQIASGDWSAKMVAEYQPVKFAAMEATFESQKGAPLHIGGIPNRTTQEVDYSIEIPQALSFLAHSDFDAEVIGLNEFAERDQPPVVIVHIAFQVMVAIGGYLLLISLWTGYRVARRFDLTQSPLFLRACAFCGPLAIVAMEAGWIVTEVGRQPWIVQGYMRTKDAVTGAEGLWVIFAITAMIYLLLFSVAIVVLRRLAAKPLEIEEKKTELRKLSKRV
jgi:cytochrome d ubiquinol oxidase subunit I